jgi:hypothetical protein
LGIPGVDTKFLEKNKRLLAKLLDFLLPQDAIDQTVTTLSGNGFENRYGLKTESPRVRLRALCPSVCAYLRGLTDLQLPVEELAQLELPCSTVFITENKTNGLAFPEMPEAIVIFGLGNAVELLAQIPWLVSRRLYYLGDLDTHGILILSRLRSHFPSVTSLLMNRSTLLGNARLWGREDEAKRFVGTLDNLTAEELELFEDLKKQQWGRNLRLEQERISFSDLRNALTRIAND